MPPPQVAMLPPNRVFVAWQDQASRRYFPVAVLSLVRAGAGRRFEFAYVEGAKEAADHGFRPFEAFPKLGSLYHAEDLFPFFKNRLVPTTRDDYAQTVTDLGLDPGSATPLEILARGGGRRATDNVELFARPAPLADGERCRVYFAVHGIRHMPQGTLERIAGLQPEAPLFLMHDRQNPIDPRALLLRTEDYLNVGYVPRYLLPDLWDVVGSASPVEIECRVDRLNPPPAAVQQRVFCRVDAPQPAREASEASKLLEPLAQRGGVLTTSRRKPELRQGA